MAFVCLLCVLVCFCMVAMLFFISDRCVSVGVGVLAGGLMSVSVSIWEYSQ